MAWSEAERNCVEMALGYHGVLTAADVKAHGMSQSQAGRRVRSSQWNSPHRGVYVLPVNSDPWLTKVAAGVAAIKDGAAAGTTAAALHELYKFRREEEVEVLSPRPAASPARDLIVHRSRVLPPEHITLVHDIPTTTVARTFVHLITCFGLGRMGRSLDDALTRELVTLDEVEEALIALGTQGRNRIGKLRQIVEERRGNEHGTILEKRFRRIIKDLPEQPVEQYKVMMPHGRYALLDFAWPKLKVGAEADSGWHENHTRYEEDLARDAQLAALGWIVLRFTSERIRKDPGGIRRQLNEVLALRSI